MPPLPTEFYRNNCTINTHHLSYRNQPHREIIAVLSTVQNTFVHPVGGSRMLVLNLVVYVLTTDYCSLTLRSLTLYIYGAPILDVSRSHTTTQHSR